MDNKNSYVEAFTTESPEWQQEFLRLAKLYNDLPSDQQKKVREQLNESRLRRLMNQ